MEKVLVKKSTVPQATLNEWETDEACVGNRC